MRKVGVVGLGLIGGSVAMSARSVGYTSLGFDRLGCTRLNAKKLGVVDESFDDLTDLMAVLEAGDIFVLAVPTLAVEQYRNQVASLLERGVIVTDVASVKHNIVALFEPLKNSQLFVAGHPIAGSEQSGVFAASTTLFKDQTVILTPTTNTSPEAVEIVSRLWRSIGSKVDTMTVEQHDAILAATSHLPHFIAFSLVDSLAGEAMNRQIFQYAAGGFRDFTRVAASDPIMWHDIALANKDAVLDALTVFEDGLAEFRRSLESNESTDIKGIFTRAQVARQHFSAVLTQRAYRQLKENSMDFKVVAGGGINGDIRVPGDKSMSHRSIMLGALAEGTTHVSGFLEGEDALATLQAFRDMGVVIEGPKEGKVTVHGVGLHGLKQPPSSLYVGNSGTTIRLLSGLLAGQSFDVEMSGDDSLAKRPMRRVTVPLNSMGAKLTTNEDGTPPIRIGGGASLKAIDYTLPMASAQVKSAVLLAGLYAQGETTVVEPAPTRDHTERMLRGFGYQVETVGNKVSLKGGGVLTATDIDVPADISSAAFFLVAASIAPNSDLTLRHVGLNPTRTGIISILRLMGADISVMNERESGGEPVGDIRVKSAHLKGIHIPEHLVPLAIDEFPVLFVAAACAEGETILTGAEELRVKESDRIQVMADGLVAVGVDATATPDGMIVRNSQITGGEVVSHGDHRIAMAFTVAALRSCHDIVIRDCENVATSFPNFVELMTECGMSIEVEKHV